MSDDGDETEEVREGTEQRLQAKLDAGTITEDEYARLTALRFGEDPAAFSFSDAADFYDLSEDELREEMAWLAEESG